MAEKQQEKQTEEQEAKQEQQAAQQMAIEGVVEEREAGVWFLRIGNEVINPERINRISVRPGQVTVFFSDGSRFQVEGKERKTLEAWLDEHVIVI